MRVLANARGIARGLLSLVAVALFSAMMVAPARASLVTTTVYDSGTDTGSGITFAGPVLGTLTTPDISFFTSTGGSWFPFGKASGDLFTSDSKATIYSGAGTYTFSTFSDDGSYLFVDGALVVSNPGPHGPLGATGTIALAAGAHSLEVQFQECCGAPSGVDAPLPAGVSYTPEPSSLAIGALGTLGLLLVYRRRAIG
jgi:hypothetical protein